MCLCFTLCESFFAPRVQQQRARGACCPLSPATPYLRAICTLPGSHRSYPSLVKSISSIFNCTAPIDGTRYLTGDLGVVCYEEWHIAFIFFAAIGAVVYALGIPLAVASVTAMRSPSHHDEEGRRQCRLCVRRKHATYGTINVRARYAFLFNGYATNRSGVIVAWEALVMIRKLAVALAGSMISDSYLQILVALLILVVSYGATAFVEPYETLWLNILDTLGLLALIVTQIVSIVYFYAETAQHPFMDSGTLEILTTTLLFALNATVLLAFALCAGSEVFGLRSRCAARHRVTLRVASAAVRDAALRACAAGAAADANCLWCHPSGIGVSRPPKMVGLNTWVWEHDTLGLSASRSKPQLLLCIGSEEALVDGDAFRTMHPTTRKLSPVETQLADVGGCGTKAQDATAPPAGCSEPRVRWVRTPVQGPQHGVELVDRSEGGDDAAHGNAMRIVTVVPVDAGAEAAVGVAVKRSAAALDENAARSPPPLEIDKRNAAAPREGPERAAQGAVRKLAAHQSGAGCAVVLVGAAEDEVWCYADEEDSTVSHGPFSLLQLKEWNDAELLADDFAVHCDGDASEEMTLRRAFFGAGLLAENEVWFFDDVVDATKRHGPFALAVLEQWSAEGHFVGTDLIRHGPDGVPVELRDAIDSPASDSGADEGGGASVGARAGADGAEGGQAKSS